MGEDKREECAQQNEQNESDPALVTRDHHDDAMCDQDLQPLMNALEPDVNFNDNTVTGKDECGGPAQEGVEEAADPVNDEWFDQFMKMMDGEDDKAIVTAHLSSRDACADPSADRTDDTNGEGVRNQCQKSSWIMLPKIGKIKW